MNSPKLSSVNSDADSDQYRSVSKATVACLAFAVLSLSALMAQIFVILPILGVGFGLVAMANFRRYPDELVGKGPAKVGLIICTVLLVASIAMHAIIYATEVPENYQRISFRDLAPNRRTSLPFSEKALELNGKQIFIKGYVRPPSGKKRKLKNFIMVGDFGDCCFGGSPKITDVIAVKISIDETVDYSYGLRRIGGVFKLNPNSVAPDEKEIPRVFYEIDANYVR
jgi:hypothetical protein